MTPPGKNAVELDNFKLKFVEAFGESKTRSEIFDKYLKYLGELKKILGSIDGLIQWIDGSFVTSKLNPRDIDLVSFIDNQIIEEHETALKGLLGFEAKSVYRVDGYIVSRKAQRIQSRHQGHCSITIRLPTGRRLHTPGWAPPVSHPISYGPTVSQ